MKRDKGHGKLMLRRETLRRLERGLSGVRGGNKNQDGNFTNYCTTEADCTLSSEPTFTLSREPIDP